MICVYSVHLVEYKFRVLAREGERKSGKLNIYCKGIIIAIAVDAYAECKKKLLFLENFGYLIYCSVDTVHFIKCTANNQGELFICEWEDIAYYPI